MQTVQKWGNSLGVRFPKAIAEQANLREGTVVEFTFVDGMLALRPPRRRKYTLDKLLRKSKGPSPHRSLDRGGPLGRELV
jgi:antitoxin MazE